MNKGLLHYVYPLSPPHRVRDPEKPMQVIALGLPRSGTDSLRSALLILGYTTVWHGFEMPLHRPNEAVVWSDLLESKARSDSQIAANFDYDTLLGDCDAMSGDNPPGIFAKELIDYYPNAKIIMNRRKDLRAWHRSLNKAINIVMGNWIVWTVRWFDTELFWWYRSAQLWISIMGKGRSFEEHGEDWARKHYESLETKMKSEGREYLEWEVENGWAPLCAFLGKAEPGTGFPWSNKSGNDFQKNAENALGNMTKRGLLRMCSLIIVPTASWSFYVAYRYFYP